MLQRTWNRRITPCHLQLAIRFSPSLFSRWLVKLTDSWKTIHFVLRGDEELDTLIKATISGGGVSESNTIYKEQIYFSPETRWFLTYTSLFWDLRAKAAFRQLICNKWKDQKRGKIVSAAKQKKFYVFVEISDVMDQVASITFNMW